MYIDSANGDSNDLVVTSRLGVRPRFELLRPAEPAFVPVDVSSTFLSEGRLSASSLTQISAIDQDLYCVFLQLWHVTNFLDHYQRLRKEPWLLKLMIQKRNAAQHCLLSLPTSQLPISAFSDAHTKADHTDLTLSELLRLAACIYSDMVIFPMAASAGVKPRLATRMRQIIISSHLYSHILQQQDRHAGCEMHIWLLWFGCFGALGTKHQPWFERQLLFTIIAIDQDVCKESYEIVFERFLGGFLWWEDACGPPARELWGRIRALHDQGRWSVMSMAFHDSNQGAQAGLEKH
jgi:hypothetical protein